MWEFTVLPFSASDSFTGWKPVPLAAWGQKRQRRLKPAATINTQKQGLSGQSAQARRLCHCNTQKQGFGGQSGHRLGACATGSLGTKKTTQAKACGYH